MNMTEQEIRDAVTNVLTQYGELVRHAQGTSEDKRRTVGAVTIQFHDDGNYSFSFAGVFQKAGTIGALFDCILTLRESINAQQAAENLAGLFEVIGLDKKDVN